MYMYISSKFIFHFQGVVTKLSDDHVACLVHDCFNASIPHPRQGDKARNGWPGFSLSVGDIVKFKVTNVDHARGVISIRGELVDENAGRKDENHTNDDDTTINAEEEIGQSAVVEDANSLTKKSRTKSFSKLKEKQQDMEAPEQVAIARNIAPEVDHSGPDDNRDNSHGSKKKSKKSKRGQFKETTAEDKSETLEKAGTVEVQIPRTKSVWAGLTKPAVLVLRDAGNATGRQSDRVIADSSSDHEVAASSHFVKTKKNRRRDHSDVSLLDIDKSRKRKSVASDTLSEVPLKKNRVDRVLEKTSQKSMSSHGFTSQSKKKKKLNHQSD